MAAKINYSTPDNYAESQNFDFTATPSPLPQQRKTYDEFNTAFTGFLAGQETPTQIADRYSNKYNIPFLQEQADKQNLQLGFLGNQIQALPSSVASASANSMLTKGQKDRIVQTQAAPLQQDYNALGTVANGTRSSLNTANANINTAIGLEQAQQLKMTQPWLQKYDAMTIMNAAENTQWTQTNQWELNELLANQNAGVTLSEGQQGRLFQLAAQEAAFQSALDNIAATGSETRKTNEAMNSMYLEGWGL